MFLSVKFEKATVHMHRCKHCNLVQRNWLVAQSEENWEDIFSAWWASLLKNRHIFTEAKKFDGQNLAIVWAPFNVTLLEMHCLSHYEQGIRLSHSLEHQSPIQVGWLWYGNHSKWWQNVKVKAKWRKWIYSITMSNVKLYIFYKYDAIFVQAFYIVRIFFMDWHRGSEMMLYMYCLWSSFVYIHCHSSFDIFRTLHNISRPD